MPDQPLHIAQICSSRAWGGLEMHVAVLSSWLAEEGHTVEIWCAPGSPLETEARRRGVPTLPFAPRGYLDLVAVLRLRRQLRQRGVDLVHAHYARDLWIITPAVRCAGGWPLVFIKHIGTARPKRDPLHRWIYGRVDEVIAISRVIEENLLATHPVPPDRVSILHHGIDTGTFRFDASARARVRREWGLREEELLIGTIGRLQPGKGHLEFLEMAAAVHDRHPEVRFVIVGEPTRGEEARADEILARRRSLGLETAVLMPGFRSDVPAVLAAMDIFAFPSRAEAFGLVLIEAMAVARPVISTRCDGVLDIVVEEENGLLFEPQNAPDLTRQVERLVADPTLRAALGARALATVEEKFTRAAMLRGLAALYARAAARHGGSSAHPPQAPA
ncbi:MAG TPA: glycosyltransferase family 4 protein [bacterium]|nr:glycosyltransferase family 4 protein [bacterium]